MRTDDGKELQRFTVRISYQPGRVLGLALIDWEEPLAEDDDPFYLRGGGSPYPPTAKAIASMKAQTSETEPSANSLPPANAMQPAKPTLSVKMAIEVVTPALAPATLNHNKRKRSTSVLVSGHSPIFMFAKHLLDATEMEFSPPSDVNLDSVRARQSVGSCCPTNFDELIDWGRKKLDPVQLANSCLNLDDINDESLKFALAGVFRPGDFVEKVEHTRWVLPASGTNDEKNIVCKRKRRFMPYCRSDHYNIIFFGNESNGAAELRNILQYPNHYPLYLTFKRWVPVAIVSRTKWAHVQSLPRTPSTNPVNIDRSCKPPLQKRFKKSESNIEVALSSAKSEPVTAIINQRPNDEVICLLDSSDEEVDESINDVTKNGERNANAQETYAGDSDSSYSRFSEGRIDIVSPLKAIVPPDPRLLPFHHDEFVLTPYGPGKILSWRVERYALSNPVIYKSGESHSDATIYKPILIYSIDLHYGTCHVSASEVKSISGTPYTETTFFMYHREPLNGMDLLRLRPMTYLNDSIVNFYLKYLKQVLS